MGYLLIRHRVADFETWKAAYEAHKEARVLAGLREEKLMRNASDPNDVVILFTSDDRKKAEDFSKSPDLRDVMQRAGVISLPEIVFLD